MSSGRVVHCKREPFDVYIGRPSPWGNRWSHLPSKFSHYHAESRADAIAKYEAWLLSNPQMIAKAKRELKNKVLGAGVHHRPAMVTC